MDPRPDFGYLSYNGTGKLEGKVAIITGGDSGIGRAVALAFSREGAFVVISYLNETEDAEEIRQIIEKEGHQVLLIVRKMIIFIEINKFNDFSQVIFQKKNNVKK